MLPSKNCSQSIQSTKPAFVGTVHTASLAVCTVLVIFVLLMGCIGNSMVIYAAVKKKRIRTNFDVLILNLTGSDFISTYCQRGRMNCPDKRRFGRLYTLWTVFWRQHHLQTGHCVINMAWPGQHILVLD
jgi:hypothetical protein